MLGSARTKNSKNLSKKMSIRLNGLDAMDMQGDGSSIKSKGSKKSKKGKVKKKKKKKRNIQIMVMKNAVNMREVSLDIMRHMRMRQRKASIKVVSWGLRLNH